MTGEREPTFLGSPTTRRNLLRSSVFASGAALFACTPSDERTVPDESSILDPERGPTPPSDLGPDDYLFFTAEELGTVEAIVARIIPGDEDDPGAIQAGVPFYIDRKLEAFEAFAEPTYHEGPFAVGYDGDDPPAGKDTISVPADELYRYGFQSPLTPQEQYRTGLAAIDRLAQTRSGALFADLDEADQDALLMVLDGVSQRSEGEEVSGPSEEEMDQAEDLFGKVDPGAFFEMMRTDTFEGMFCDPVYGGNRGLVGWSLVGWPGAQRSYSPHEMKRGTSKQPTSMEGLTPMNPDRAGGGREAIEQYRTGVHNH